MCPQDDGYSLDRLGVHCRQAEAGWVYGKKFKLRQYATGSIQVKPVDNDVTYYRPGSGEIKYATVDCVPDWVAGWNRMTWLLQ
jgi:hypothetical protein